MFGARDDDGWRLCHRKGRTIFFVNEEKFPDFPIEFRNQKSAKACADDLNAEWANYWRLEEKGEPVSFALFKSMLDTIVFHDGLSKQDHAEIMNATKLLQ